jgi:hypothetical protein
MPLQAAAMNALLFLVLACVPEQNPPLSCAKPVIDLGPTRGGPTLTQTFEVVNKGEAALTIVHIQPSCGCIVSKVSGQVVKPGEAVAVAVQIGTLSQPEGDNLWTARLFYRVAGSETNQIFDLQVRAKLTREVSVQPAALRLSGKPGLAHEITLTDRRAKPMEITSVATSSSNIAVLDESGWQRTDDGWQRKLRVRLAADCPAGKHEEIVQLVSSDPDYREMRIEVNVNRTDTMRYAVSPGEARLTCEAGKGGETLVLIRDAEGQPVQIESAEPDDAALTCRFSEQAQATSTLRIIAAAGATPQRWSSVRVRMKAPAAQTVAVPVTVLQANPAR